MNRTTLVSSTAALIAGIAIGSVGIAFGGPAPSPAQPSFTSALAPASVAGQTSGAPGMDSRESTPAVPTLRPSDDVRTPATTDGAFAPRVEAPLCAEHEYCRIDHRSSAFQMQTQTQARVQTDMQAPAQTPVGQHEQWAHSATSNQATEHGEGSYAPHDGSHDGRGDHGR